MATTSTLTHITPYVAIHLSHFPTTVYTDTIKDAAVEIHPMWSGEGNLSYLVVNTQTKEAMLIDPDLETLGSYMITLDKNELTLKAVLDTHTHAEHATACPTLAKVYNVPYIMHTLAQSSFVTDHINDGDSISIAGIPVSFIHTPGHTPCLTSIYIGKHLFTGDSLFNKGCGRTDLPGGSAETQYDSLQTLISLSDDHVVHPGHDYNDELSATIADIKKQNKRVQFSNKNDFAEFMKEHYKTNEKPDDLMYYVNFNQR